jgi:hypothetical protein
MPRRPAAPRGARSLRQSAKSSVSATLRPALVIRTSTSSPVASDARMKNALGKTNQPSPGEWCWHRDSYPMISSCPPCSLVSTTYHVLPVSRSVMTACTHASIERRPNSATGVNAPWSCRATGSIDQSRSSGDRMSRFLLAMTPISYSRWSMWAREIGDIDASAPTVGSTCDGRE